MRYLTPVAKPYLDYQHVCGDGNTNNLRTTESQTVHKLKNNEARPKFTGSYKIKACSVLKR